MKPAFFEDCAKIILKDPSRWIDPVDVYSRGETRTLRAAARSKRLFQAAVSRDLPQPLAVRVLATWAGYEPLDKALWSSGYLPPFPNQHSHEEAAVKAAYRLRFPEILPRSSGYRSDGEGRFYGTFEYGSPKGIGRVLSWFGLSIGLVRQIGPTRFCGDETGRDALYRVSDGSTVISQWRPSQRPSWERARSAIMLKQATAWTVIAADKGFRLIE